MVNFCANTTTGFCIQQSGLSSPLACSALRRVPAVGEISGCNSNGPTLFAETATHRALSLQCSAELHHQWWGYNAHPSLSSTKMVGFFRYSLRPFTHISLRTVEQRRVMRHYQSSIDVSMLPHTQASGICCNCSRSFSSQLAAAVKYRAVRTV